MTRGKSSVEARFRLRLTRGDEILLGPGKVDLLEAIAREGSITAAARALGMSYRRAWELIDDLNGIFGQPVVESKSGGKKGGGATLTPLGLSLISRYRAMERAAAAATEPHLVALLKELQPSK